MIKNVWAGLISLAFISGILGLVSCSQDEGFGGNSEIKGVVIERIYNKDFSVLLSEAPAKAEDVFILFGDDTSIGDKVETSYTGEFSFTYLWPGNYTLYYLSDDTTNATLQDMEMKHQVSLNKNETLDLGTFYTFKTADWDDGSIAIKGVLIERIYNDDMSLLLSEEPAKTEDVYIALANNDAFNDNVETNYNGRFEFSNLWPGNYTIYYMSDDTSDASQPDMEFKQTVALNKNEDVLLDTMYTYKIKEWDEGSSTIRGTVMVTNYKNSSTYPNLVIKDVTPAQEQEVYITYGTHTFYDDRIRTQDDGSFEFNHLIKGEYRIFVYSEDIVGGTAYKVIEAFVEVTDNGQVIELEDTIDIEKL